MVDRSGARAVLIGTITLLVPLPIALPQVGAVAATVLLGAVGFFRDRDLLGHRVGRRRAASAAPDAPSHAR